MSQLLLTSNIYHPLNGGWKFVKTEAFLKVVCKVTVDYHLSRPPPRLVHKLALNTHLCTARASQETRNLNFLRRWAFLQNIARAFTAI